MLEAKDFMDNFMKELDGNRSIKENILCCEQDMPSTFIYEQVSAYSKLLKTGILSQVEKEE